MPIYTKTGDEGKTSLFGGARTTKFDSQIEAYGTIDELTSYVGMVISKTTRPKDKEVLVDIQKDLYQIMGYLAGADQNLDNLSRQTKNFERKIDAYEEKLPKLTKFILPGGNELSSWYHIIRTITRRAERRVTQYFYEQGIQHIGENRTVIQYLNRLSDLFFTVARFYNDQGELLTK